MRLAVTGHRRLGAETTRLVDASISSELHKYDPADLVGISCLADGADQIFAQAVLDLGGTLVVVVPAAKYRAGLPAGCHATYDALLGQAQDVHRLAHIESTEQAHMDGSQHMLDHADALLAVWDGKPARGYGGTADVMARARERGLDVTIIWPDGASR